MTQDTRVLMEALKAENILSGSQLLTEIAGLRDSLKYQSNEQVFSYDDYYFTLQKQIEKMPRIALQPDVAPSTESQYQIKLSQALEAVYDDADRVMSHLLHFLSKLKGAQERMDTLKASFVAWYSLAATQYLTTYDLDLGKTVIADLARAEFERLMLGLDVEVNSLVQAVKVQVTVVQKRKSTAQDKFNLGKDQANAAWTSHLMPANVGTSSDPEARSLLVQENEQLEEDVPDYVSRKPHVSGPIGGPYRTPLFPADVESDALDQIRGNFKKTGDPAPATVIEEKTKENTPYCGKCQEPGCPWCYPKKIEFPSADEVLPPPITFDIPRKKK